MFAHRLQVFLNPGYFFFVTENFDDVVSRYNTQFGEERLDDLEMNIVYPVKNNGINIF